MSVDITTPAYKTKLGNPTAKGVLVVLADAANQDGFGWPSVAKMADSTELSERQVKRVIQCFQEIGLVVKLKSHNERYKYAFQINVAMLGTNLTAAFGEAMRRAQGNANASDAENNVCETQENVCETQKDVCETQKDVCQTQKDVCQTFPPHPLYRRTVIEPSGNRQAPPAAKGELCAKQFGGMELQVAHELFREFRIPSDAGLVRVAAQALVFECDRLGSPELAFTAMRNAMECGRYKGELLNRFWFQDQRYLAGNAAQSGKGGLSNGATHASATQQRIDRNRKAARAAAERAGWAGADAAGNADDRALSKPRLE